MWFDWYCVNEIVVNGSNVWIRGKKMPACPAPGRNAAIVKGTVYVNGYELKNGEWKKTLRAWLYTKI